MSESHGGEPCRRLLFRVLLMPTKATIIELDMNELEDILRRVEAKELRADDYETIHAVLESYACLTNLVGDKNASLSRLRKMLFGAKTEKTAAVVGKPEAAALPLPAEVKAEAAAADDSKPPAKGHGRNGADAYTGAEKIEVPHESLTPGDPCPKCETGTIYETARPGVLVRFTGQSPVQAKVYYLQKLRCNLCGEVFTARTPEDAGEKRYDATVGSMIALMKYGTGMPFNREERLQKSLGVPLPASTQWEIVHAQAEHVEPVFAELVRQAGQGEIVHNDDTTIKILELMGARDKQAARDGNAVVSSAENLAADDADDCENESAEDLERKKTRERRGTFTSGIVSISAGRRIALFFSGRQHAGENLTDVLAQRSSELPPPIQMCDALTRNLPAKLKTIVANCLAHGRRRFVDVAEAFPEPCRHVLESLSVVYRNDAVAQKRKRSPEERLFFHQAESGPVMEELHAWLVRQFDERRVEPNSGLGKAISYLLRHWDKLTLFLRQAGAPLDNNLCDRILKKAILHRKNALFYKTCCGAHVGDVFMSLIHTCELNAVNPFDYLTELERQVGELSANPQNWLPWSYRETLAAVTAPASTR
jgi:transposase